MKVQVGDIPIGPASETWNLFKHDVYNEHFGLANDSYEPHWHRSLVHIYDITRNPWIF